MASTASWEYLAMDIGVGGFLGPDINPQSVADSLNEAGRRGWELVSTTPVTRGEGRTVSILAVFKRPTA